MLIKSHDWARGCALVKACMFLVLLSYEENLYWNGPALSWEWSLCAGLDVCWPMVPNGSGLCVRVMVHVCWVMGVGLGWGGELNSFSCNAHYAIFDRACTRVGNVGHDRL